MTMEYLRESVDSGGTTQTPSRHPRGIDTHGSVSGMTTITKLSLLVLVVVGGLTLAINTYVHGVHLPTMSSPAKPNLVDAPLGALSSDVESHDAGSLTITLSGASFGTRQADVTALLDYLGFNSSAVVARMENTRALDGTQSDKGRYASVHWNYSPDGGHNLVFESV